jgi:secondary thiamine-phosphate synthase enzyme
MISMHTYTLTRALATGPDMADITQDLKRCLAESGVTCGFAHLFAVGSTGSLTTVEYETGVVEDLKRAITETAPPDRVYAHEMTWHDGNGHSHVQAALIGPSLSIPVRNGRLTLGTWQQVLVINHDNGPRDRKIEVTIQGS